MNLIKLGKGLSGDQRIFRTTALNDIIIFKYPNFSDKDSPSIDSGIPMDCDVAENNKPIETGLYIPHHVLTPSNGGYVIYLRSKSYETLFHDHFGIDFENLTDDVRHDLKLLGLIDSIPSLDAFLLKSCLEAEKVEVDKNYLVISDQEDGQLRALIRSRIEPIVRKALNTVGGDSAVRVERFLEAVWNPKLQEAKLFITAFGIEPSEAELIFCAWKGITFYEFQLRKIAKQATAVIGWLKSKESVPSDIRNHKMWETNILMYIEKVGKDIDSVMGDIRRVLVEYDRCFNSFMSGDPKDFRRFLQNVNKEYWLMGYCISSLSSIVHTYERYMQSRVVKQLAFNEMQSLLKQFEVAVDRRREMTAAF